LSCIESNHRNLGTHISKIRSLIFDSWNDQQLAQMRVGGNEAFIQFIEEHGVSNTTDCFVKYNSAAAALYRQKILDESQGKTWIGPGR